MFKQTPFRSRKHKWFGTFSEKHQWRGICPFWESLGFISFKGRSIWNLIMRTWEKFLMRIAESIYNEDIRTGSKNAAILEGFDMGEVHENPVGFISFYSNEEYSQACSYCSDYNLDVLETVIYNFDMLVFFCPEEMYSCALFCLSNLFHVTVFGKICHSGLHWCGKCMWLVTGSV